MKYPKIGLFILLFFLVSGCVQYEYKPASMKIENFTGNPQECERECLDWCGEGCYWYRFISNPCDPVKGNFCFCNITRKVAKVQNG